MLAETILTRAITQLNESDPPVQWTRNELIASLNEARRLICDIKPDAGEVTEGVRLAPGARQALPAGGQRFLKLPSLLHTTETNLHPIGRGAFAEAAAEDIQAFGLDERRTLLLWRDMGAGGIGRSCLAVRTGYRVRYTTPVEWADGYPTYFAAALLDSTRVAVFWADRQDGNQGKLRVLEIDEETITLGEQQVVATAQISYPAICRLHVDLAVLAWRDDDEAGDCMAVAVRISGDYSQLGTVEQIGTAALTYLALAPVGPLKAMLAYSDDDASGRGAARVISVDGYDLTVGTEAVFESGDTTNIRLVRLTSGTLLAAYTDVGNSSQGTACGMSVSGTTITAGTPVVFETGSTSGIGLVALKGNRAAVAYRDAGNSGYGTAAALSLAALVVSAGTPLVLNSVASAYCGVAAAGDDNLAVFYQDGTAEWGYGVLLGLNSTTGLSLLAPTQFEADDADNLVAVQLDETHVLCAYADAGNSNRVTATCMSIIDGVITVGTPLQVDTGGASAQSNPIALAMLSGTAALIAWRDAGDSGKGKVAVLAIAGTVVTTGAEVEFHATEVQWLAIARLTNHLALVCFRDEAVDDDAKCYPVTIAASAPTVPVVGTVATVFAGDSTGIQAVGFSATQAVVVLLREGSNDDLAAYPIEMVAGVPTPGTALVIEASAQAAPSLRLIGDNRALLAWQSGAQGNRVRAAVLWSDGDTAGIGDPVDVTGTPASQAQAAVFDDVFCAVGYRDEEDANAVRAVVLRRRDMTLEVAEALQVSTTSTVDAPIVAFQPNQALLLHRGTTGVAHLLERPEPEYAGEVLLGDLDTMDRRVPGWRNQTPADPTCFLVDPLERTRYWVSPPVSRTGSLYGNLQYMRYPDEIPASTDAPPYSAALTEFGLAEEYGVAALAWMLYRAFGKEDELEVLNKAQAQLEVFMRALGLESSGQLAGLAQVRSFPFTPASPKPEAVKT